MPFVADLHVHSHYSRSTSGQMNPEGLYRWAQIKGITVLGTGDFTHPRWFEELREKLEPAEPGLFTLKSEFAAPVDETVPASCRAPVRFLISTEISCISSRGGRTRKVHNLVYCPDFAAAARVNTALAAVGNLASDGRPILGLDSRHLLDITLTASERNILVPAHVWTPHFSVFGAFSGFETLEECYDDLTPHIFAIETGLSSDPPMNRRLSQLDRIALISNSDAHSPSKLAREANVFETELSYNGIFDAVRANDAAKFLCTIEFFPEEGKYHYDGHRACDVRLTPAETEAHGGRCPKCGRKVTVGVCARVHALADRAETAALPRPVPFESLIPLQEILAEIRGVGAGSKKVEADYFNLIERLGPELGILRHAALDDIAAAGGPPAAQAIGRVRRREVYIAPGYDGAYGVIRIFEPIEKQAFSGQLNLF